MRTFAIINQKGGCGKTTTSINLASSFAALGKKTLLIDMDPQSHCALGLAVPENQVDRSMADAMLAPPDNFDLNAILWQISSHLDLAPSTVSLAGVEHKLNHLPKRDLRLMHLLKSVAEEYDTCVIDCPPSIGFLTFNALRAANEVIIPVETGYFSLNGAIKQATTLQILSDQYEHPVCFHVLPTMYDLRTKMAREIVSELRKHFGDRVIPTPIHFNAKLKEAASFGQSITEYDSASRGCQDFERLARHLLASDHVPRRIASHVSTQQQTSDDLVPTCCDHETASSTTTTSSSASLPLSSLITTPTDRPTSQTITPSIPRTTDRTQVVAADTHPAPSTTVSSQPNARTADLVQRAQALIDRTHQMHRRLTSDPDVKHLELDRDANLSTQTTEARSGRSTLTDKLQGLYGVRPTQQGMLFIQPDLPCEQVSIAGDFNNWSVDANPMQRDQKLGIWQTCLSLEPGTYQYRLVMDGQWTADPHNQQTTTNPFGEINSIVQVAESSATASVAS